MGLQNQWTMFCGVCKVNTIIYRYAKNYSYIHGNNHLDRYGDDDTDMELESTLHGQTYIKHE